MNKEQDLRPERVLFMLSPENPVRRLFVYIGDHFLFSFIIHVAIVISCFFLFIAPSAEDDPWFDLNVVSRSVQIVLNTTFTIIFTVEFVVRVMSQGLLLTKNAYLKSGWNILDTTVLVFAWMDETNVIKNASVGKVFRLARALRPLRLMKRNVGMRIIIDALIGTLAPVGYVIIFCAVNFLVFAIIGTGLFGGMLYDCTGTGAQYPGGKIECSGAWVTQNGVMMPRSWESPFWNFDSIAESVQTLFRMSTEKYVSVINSAMDITEFNKSPSVGASEAYFLFFVIYMIIGALFIINIFVGFIVDGFNLNKVPNPKHSIPDPRS